MKTKLVYITILLSVSFCLTGCEKMDEWLDTKRQKEQVSPETLKDFQAILDAFFQIHNIFPTFGLVGADDIYLTDQGFAGSDEIDRNAYIWNQEIWVNDNADSWNASYQVIFKSNVVLEGMGKLQVDQDQQQIYNDIIGQALFYRAIFCYNLAQLFCKPYSTTTASTDLGLPLRLTSDANYIAKRSSVKETYEQMVKDAEDAMELLPINSLNNRRPNRAAAYALLAKIYLCMEEYEQARGYADLSLQLHDSLLDFNSDYVSTSLTYRFPYEPFDHPEITFYAQGTSSFSVAPLPFTLGIVDSVLYEQYDEFDLRKVIFFEIDNDFPQYRGAYTGSYANFCGIATNEVYLIRSECNARLSNIPSAIADLNTLLRHRYVTGEFGDHGLMDQEEALRLILTERRKELIGVSNIRWEDLRRLNKDERFKITLRRVINGETYSLEPHSNRYILPIPDNEIQLSGIEQNPR